MKKHDHSCGGCLHSSAIIAVLQYCGYQDSPINNQNIFDIIALPNIHTLTFYHPKINKDDDDISDDEN